MTKADWFARSGSSPSLGEEYEEKGVPGHEYFVRVKSHHFLRVLEERQGALDRLACLDDGCGTGETTAYFEGRFARLVGTDYATGMLVRAADRSPRAKWAACTSEALSFTSGSFDAVALFNMIHHIDEEAKLLRTLGEARRILRPRGTLAIYDMNPYNPLTRRVVETNEIDAAVHLDGWKERNLPTTFFPREIVDVLEHEGWSVWRLDYLCFFPKPLSFLLPLERAIARLPLGGLYAVFAEPRITGT